MWVVDGVHRGTENCRSDTHPSLSSGLTDNDLAVVYIGNSTDGSETLLVNFSDFSGRHLHLSVLSFLGKDESGSSGGSNGGSPLTDNELYIVNLESYWNIPDEHSVTGDWLESLACGDDVSNLHVLVSKNISSFSVSVANEGDVPSSEWIVLNSLNLSWNIHLVEPEVYVSVELLVSSTLMSYCDSTGRVSSCSLELEASEWLVRNVRGDLIEGVASHLTAPWSRWIILFYWHTTELRFFGDLRSEHRS